ncbi:tetratricopeptide repeat protein [candidate division KSB1 bacterium]
MKLFNIFVVTALFSSITLIACGSDESSPSAPVRTIDDIILEGWSAFEQSPPDYNGAIDLFTEALALEDGNPEALTGRGWCYAFLAFGPDDVLYDSALNNFNEATLSDPNAIDAWAGLAFVRFVINAYNTALAYANTVLSMDNEYVFEHNPDITINDIHLIRAHIYYYQGKYSSVVTILDLLQPGVAHPADNPEILLSQLQDLWGAI